MQWWYYKLGAVWASGWERMSGTVAFILLSFVLADEANKVDAPMVNLYPIWWDPLAGILN